MYMYMYSIYIHISLPSFLSLSLSPLILTSGLICSQCKEDGSVSHGLDQNQLT